MAAQPQKKQYFSPQEYLALERQAEYKSEYFDGELFARAGASRWHNLIVTNIIRELSLQLKGRQCNVYSSDMRVKVSQTGLYTYPDVLVVCDKEEFEDEVFDTLLNPTVIIEVLSKSTTGYDKGEKFSHYRQLESLEEYLLIARKECHIEHYVRQPDEHWDLSDVRHLQNVVELPSITCRLALNEVYDKVEIEKSV